MCNTNIQEETILEQIKRINEEDNNIVTNIVDNFINKLYDEINNNENFSLKHGFLTIGKLLVILAQSLCDNEEHFSKECDLAKDIVLNKIMEAIMPKVDCGKVIDEDFDIEDLSIRRIMLTLGIAIDYIIWKTDLTKKYQENSIK
ncbi:MULTISPECIES: hypothetical protein [unclassified Clostridioides]|uniref:hypothetical protein n=1 Tax=unclassified Clostridioides TaxID=2635829 RepID=UPI001D1209FD|nr:hypothetical protein [Clostridioides sp. ES-S-0001-02]MCC0657338.1 hypothetical protein [Clostridioides sp. ES-S-0123-01]MCC0672743.1 hypothetical protein [Clostridioides sp. ES-S-0145-01]MCC0679941.1 hypothetical protein [Clostridioides sp. ES-S-0005-03]UDN46175.1 hypothetical protein JJJ25_11480 [Clostridioides sp. ES-S-0173-01]UDN59849.1 hypothetical protein JJC01_08300 [Clostridioides sp. ES-S-0010-02]UDN60627.1 hypothetical protein IC758_12260 [Clostridioides sp. ES-W-0016-02]